MGGSTGSAGPLGLGSAGFSAGDAGVVSGDSAFSGGAAVAGGGVAVLPAGAFDNAGCSGSRASRTTVISVGRVGPLTLGMWGTAVGITGEGGPLGGFGTPIIPDTALLNVAR